MTIFSELTSPVTIVTTKLDDKLNGITIAWTAQVSLSPFLVIVSIAPERYSHGLIKKSRVFAINMLADDQIEVGKRFGFASGRNKDKFAGLNYKTAETGSPILEGIYGYIDCELVDVHKAGDHDLFLGKVVKTWVDPAKKPLTFHANDFF